VYGPPQVIVSPVLVDCGDWWEATHVDVGGCGKALSKIIN
jgi:hypothetical protein